MELHRHEHYPVQRQRYAMLFGLIAATGLRISEALDLQRSDILPGSVLHIREAKFGKSRLVPLHATVRDALDRYLSLRTEATRTASQLRNARRLHVSGRPRNAFGISGEGVRRCRLSVQPRARGVSTIWQASVTKRLGAGEGRQRPIPRLPRRRAHASSLHPGSSQFRKCASRFFRKCASRNGLGAPIPAVPRDSRSQPCRQALSFAKIRVGTGSRRPRFRARLAFEPARGEAAHIF